MAKNYESSALLPEVIADVVLRELQANGDTIIISNSSHSECRGFILEPVK